MIELLTVVGIISLLIAILTPAFSQARRQAQRVKVRATLAGIEKGLQLFRMDYGEFPSSEVQLDPITDLTPGYVNPWGLHLWGPHRLARAMVGHDGQGFDTAGRTLKDGMRPENKITKDQANLLERRKPYIERITFVRDNDPRFQPDTNMGKSGRLILVDDFFWSPILYYRGKPRAHEVVCVSGSGNGDPGTPTGDRAGVYCLWDNMAFTGTSTKGVGAHINGTPVGFWDFANTGLTLPAHPLGEIGSLAPDHVKDPPPYHSGVSFAGMVHDEAILKTTGLVKPRNPDGFMLIDAGPDGLYGTDDDVTNF